MTNTRPHRTLEEWYQVQKARLEEPAPEVLGQAGQDESERDTLRVNVYGQLWQAPKPEALKAEGYEVRIHHARKYRPVPKVAGERWWNDVWGKQKLRDERGGRTTVELLAPDGRWARGTVKCYREDRFSRRIGYVLAVNRALENLQAR